MGARSIRSRTVDDSGTCPVLRRYGPTEKHPQYDDALVRNDGSRQCCVGRSDLFLVIWKDIKRSYRWI